MFWEGYTPKNSGSRISSELKRDIGDCAAVVSYEWEDRGGVGKFESGT